LGTGSLGRASRREAKKRAELRRLNLAMIIWKDGKIRAVSA
jgi:hypothetical protein